MTLSIWLLYFQNKQHGTVLHTCQDHFSWLVFLKKIVIWILNTFSSYVNLTDQSHWQNGKLAAVCAHSLLPSTLLPATCQKYDVMGCRAHIVGLLH